MDTDMFGSRQYPEAEVRRNLSTGFRSCIRVHRWLKTDSVAVRLLWVFRGLFLSFLSFLSLMSFPSRNCQSQLRSAA